MLPGSYPNKNIWFVCSETSYSGYKRRCYYAGRTNKQLKIELLSQWKLEAESRNSSNLVHAIIPYELLAEDNHHNADDFVDNFYSVTFYLIYYEVLIMVQNLRHCFFIKVIKIQGNMSPYYLVNCPTRWSLSFIFVFLCWSSIFPIPDTKKYSTAMC